MESNHSPQNTFPLPNQGLHNSSPNSLNSQNTQQNIPSNQNSQNNQNTPNDPYFTHPSQFQQPSSNSFQNPPQPFPPQNLNQPNFPYQNFPPNPNQPPNFPPQPFPPNPNFPQPNQSNQSNQSNHLNQPPTPFNNQPNQPPTPYNNQFSTANQPPITTTSATDPRTDHPLSTHSQLLISELRDSMAIMKDGSFRAVIACQSINFDLMSETEREGVEYSFQNFLNSLHFTTQILIRSQRVDIGPYIDSLVKIRRNNDNMLLGVLMDDYINFIDILSQEANIMDKSFFIVIPYYSSPDAEKLVEQTKNFFKSFSNTKAPEITRIDRMTYDKAITELNNRVDAVVGGLYQIGIHAIRLNTKELGQLYYNFNNPDTAVRQPLVDFNNLANIYVKKGTQP